MPCSQERQAPPGFRRPPARPAKKRPRPKAAPSEPFARNKAIVNSSTALTGGHSNTIHNAPAPASGPTQAPTAGSSRTRRRRRSQAGRRRGDAARIDASEAFTSGRAATHRRAPCFPWPGYGPTAGATSPRTALQPARAPALFGKRGNHVAERRTIRCRHRARLEYPPPRKGPRQRGFSPYRAARPSAHGGLRRHFATRYGAPAAPSVGQNGSQDLEIATGDDTAGARAFPKRPQRERVSYRRPRPGRRRDPAVGIAGQRLAHEFIPGERTSEPVARHDLKRTRFTCTAAPSER